MVHEVEQAYGNILNPKDITARYMPMLPVLPAEDSTISGIYSDPIYVHYRGSEVMDSFAL